MDKSTLQGLQIGKVRLENNLVLGRRDRPAISYFMQRTGRRADLHGNGQRQGLTVQQ